MDETTFDQRRDVSNRFWEIILGHPDLVQQEFDQIVHAAWPTRSAVVSRVHAGMIEIHYAPKSFHQPCSSGDTSNRPTGHGRYRPLGGERSPPGLRFRRS
jgi:hypothetical protein